MNACDLLRRLHEHRLWVNGLLCGAARLLSRDQLHQPFPIGQGSVWQSLIHLYVAEYVWLEALEGDCQPKLPSELLGQPLGCHLGATCGEPLEELSALWRALDDRWAANLAALTDQTLTETVYKTSPGSPVNVAFATSRSDVLMHVCTHAHYTAAQLVNMLRSLGVKSLPDPMLITLARQQSPNPPIKID